MTTEETCSDCPPFGYPNDKTRCLPCPRRATITEEARAAQKRIDALFVEKIANQYGCRQAAALRGDEFAVKVADFWLAQAASGHWHEIIAALRRPPPSEEQPHGTTVKP